MTIGTAMLYFLFGITGICSPPLVNKLGPRTCLFAGAFTYVIFCVVYTLVGAWKALPYWTVTLALAGIGLGAGPLWNAEAILILSYPTDGEKGTYLGTCWAIFNSGSVFFGLQAWVTNMHGKNPSGDGSPNPVTFMIMVAISVVAALLTWALTPLEKVVRSDGTKCEPVVSKPLGEEIKAMAAVVMNKRVIALVPLFWYSNWFYAYQLSKFSSNIFTTSGSGLASALYWGAQMVGAKCLALITDNTQVNVQRRAYVSLGCSVALIAIGWVWGYFANSTYKLDGIPTLYDWNQPGFVEAGALMTLWGFCDALIQNWVYWVIVQLYQDPADLGRMAGVFKGVQAVGNAMAFLLCATSLKPSVHLYSSVLFFLISLPGAFYLCAQLAKSKEDVEKLMTNP